MCSPIYRSATSLTFLPRIKSSISYLSARMKMLYLFHSLFVFLGWDKAPRFCFGAERCKKQKTKTTKKQKQNEVNLICIVETGKNFYFIQVYVKQTICNVLTAVSRLVNVCIDSITESPADEDRWLEISFYFSRLVTSPRLKNPVCPTIYP